MDIQVTTALRRIYDDENHRIVFWYDGDREFEDTIAALVLDGVKIIRLDETGGMELKILLELEDAYGKYLLYAPFHEPAPNDDWLLDIRLYSRVFRADRASILLDELGLSNHAMRDHIGKYKAFFSKDRLNRMKKWVQPGDSEKDLDMKMMAVLAKAEQPNAFSIVTALFADLAGEKLQNMLIPSIKAWNDIERYQLSPAFWDLAAETFGYGEKSPSLSDLLIRLLVTDFSHGLKADCPEPLRHFVLSERGLALNASVFLSQWRNDMTYYESYGSLSRRIGEELKIREHIGSFDEAALIDAMTFEVVEQRIVSCLRDHMTSKDPLNPESITDVIRRRRDGYWARPLFNTTDKGNGYISTYDALEAACGLLALREKQASGLSYPTAEAMYKAYREGLFEIDQTYRFFQEAADQVELKGWDILKGLRKVVEDCYSWFIDQEALCWGSFIDTGAKAGLLHRWAMEGIRNQYAFYTGYVAPLLKGSNQGKVYVIVSDAFRYEAAEELTREINGKYRFKATLDSMLGVLPSYTALGMAALLPHESIEYKENAALEVLVDGQPTSSIEQRSKILSAQQGTAIKYEDLMAMNKDQGREFVKPWRVIYVYHNQIDSVGDSASSESKTFAAVRTAIKDIYSLISFIINSLNGSMVMVTADHGFLYQDRVPEEADKSALSEKPAGTLKAKKRYVLGSALGDAPKVWHGDTKTTAGTDSAMEFWIPKGSNRFHFAGGARYIHGGAMLQEIFVPVVTVKELTGQAKERSAVRKVDVVLLGTVHKVVNNVERFEFIQTDAVSERALPRILTVSLRDGEELISDEVTLTFDSQSSSMDERKRSARLTVKAKQYDKKREYALVLRDAETTIEYTRIGMKIDLSIINDF